MSMAPVSTEHSEPARLAREAIKMDATAVQALEVLGLQAQLRGDTSRAREIFSQSIKLSRRELRPQIWAIEDAVSRGDIAGALRQYDIALRTSRRAYDTLFPVLAAAIAEPKIRQHLITLLQTGPVWSERFITYVGRGTINPVAAVPFFRAGELADLPIDDVSRTSLVNALVKRGEVGRAWDYYKSFRDARTISSRNPNFSESIDDPAVFDWTPSNAPGLSVSIQQGREGGSVDFSAAPSVGGIAIEQRQFLAPGAYKFESVMEGIEQPDRSRPYWALTCQSGRRIARFPVPNSGDAPIRFERRLNVPSGCVAQSLALVVRPSDEISGVYGRVLSAQLLRANDNE